LTTGYLVGSPSLLRELHKIGFFDNNSTPASTEQLSRHFLLFLGKNTDPLIRSVSSFEYGFLEVRAGSTEIFDIVWDRNPDVVFRAIEYGSEMPGPEIGYAYCMRIDGAMPGLFTCTFESVSSCTESALS
jgi:hypothetical protein